MLQHLKLPFRLKPPILKSALRPQSGTTMTGAINSEWKKVQHHRPGQPIRILNTLLAHSTSSPTPASSHPHGGGNRGTCSRIVFESSLGRSLIMHLPRRPFRRIAINPHRSPRTQLGDTTSYGTVYWCPGLFFSGLYKDFPCARSRCSFP